MHREFRSALTEAVGQSEFVIVVVADIRGFSAFSKERESPDTAMYIKRVYSRLMDEYFPNASFYKPTGDGLLIAIPYGEHDLEDVLNQAVQACVNCVRDFSSICESDPMINFPTPQRIGFGLARGTACCLISGEKVLDYSGHLLNLASRLMDLARPAGIVLEGTVGLRLLKPELQTEFEEATAYIRSIAEESPITIYIQKGHVRVPAHAKSPLARDSWTTIEKKNKLSQRRQMGPRYGIDLPFPLKRPDALDITFEHPLMKNRRRIKGAVTVWHYTDWEHDTSAGRNFVTIDLKSLLATMNDTGMPSTAEIRLLVKYVPSEA